jgi:RNA recognition motif-containing protein
LKKNQGKPLYCFIEFSTQEEALLAIEKYNSFIFYSRKFSVKKTITHSTTKKRINYFLKLLIKHCQNSILNEKELKKFDQSDNIDHQIYFFEDEDGTLIVNFNLKNRIDVKKFILSKNENIYQGEKIYIQYSIYKIPTHLNFLGFPTTTTFEEAFDFFSQFGKVFQLILLVTKLVILFPPHLLNLKNVGNNLNIKCKNMEVILFLFQFLMIFILMAVKIY